MTSEVGAWILRKSKGTSINTEAKETVELMNEVTLIDCIYLMAIIDSRKRFIKVKKSLD
jgi:hypothetical protein